MVPPALFHGLSFMGSVQRALFRAAGLCVPLRNRRCLRKNAHMSSAAGRTGDDCYECIVIGAGIAGASVAWQLAAATTRRLLLLEQELQPGSHATAQNAAMVRSLTSEPELLPLAIEGARFWNDPPSGLLPLAAFRRCGSLLLVSRQESLAMLERRVGEARQLGWPAEILTAKCCRSRFPLLDDTALLGAAWTPGDGVADPAALLVAFLAAARLRGAELRLESQVRRILCERGAVIGVELGSGEQIQAERVVIAAGAWSAELAQTAGAVDAGLRPTRRHLFCTSSRGKLPSGMPFFWHLDLEAYFRSEAGGLLFSACDESPASPGRPEIAVGIEDFASERLSRVFPFLLDLSIKTCWAGLRTQGLGVGFLLGCDPTVAGLFHAAGLGGHGVTCAYPIGRIVSEAVLSAPINKA